jgi:cyclopropane fatty-acyl-phospholipid synthase-like methyltransferase
MWDDRYSAPGYAYGVEPNEFVVATRDQLPANGRLLCLAEGEGRNAVWLARQGFEVTAVDSSSVGIGKARQLADQHAVRIDTVHADLTDFTIDDNHWDGIVSIFCHLSPPLRRQVHARCVSGLRPGGIMLLEAYTPRQLEYKTGGPPVIDMMMDSETLTQELDGLEFLQMEECTREIHEGEFHHGTGAVVQMVARKPL